MLKRLLPRQDGFFVLFKKAADTVVLAATQMHIMFIDLEHQHKYVDEIANYENQGDEIAHSTFELLHKTFITPFDRHDIHRLTSQLDDVLDLINRCAQHFPIFELTHIPQEVIDLAELAVQCTKLLKKALYRIHSLKQADEILQFCEDLSFLENNAHNIVLEGEKKLYLEENNFKCFFKLHETYSRLKLVINRCQDVANVIKGIVLEYS